MGSGGGKKSLEGLIGIFFRVELGVGGGAIPRNANCKGGSPLTRTLQMGAICWGGWGPSNEIFGRIIPSPAPKTSFVGLRRYKWLGAAVLL